MRLPCRPFDPRLVGVLAIAVAIGVFPGPSAAREIVQGATPDEPTALVVFPLIRVDTASGLDTFLRLSNASTLPADLRCFYENTTAHCSTSGDICTVDAECPVGGVCLSGWTISDFAIRLTPRQPVEWRASQGLAVLPAAGNEGVILPTAEDPFVGALRCVVIDPDTGLPPTPGGAASNVLEGVATIERAGDQAIELARYRAIGFPSLTSDGDGVIEIGNELEPCPNAVILSHLFDGAAVPIDGFATSATELAIVPCSADYLTQTPVATAVHFIIFNEFAQRTGLSARLGPQLFAPLSRLHPTVFNVGVQGALAGQTRIVGAGSGVIGVAIRTLSEGDARLATQATVLLNNSGQRLLEVITLPPP